MNILKLQVYIALFAVLLCFHSTLANASEQDCNVFTKLAEIKPELLHQLWIKSEFSDLVIIDKYIYLCPCTGKARIAGSGDQARVGGAGDQARIGGATGLPTCKSKAASPIGYEVRSITGANIYIYDGFSIRKQ